MIHRDFKPQNILVGSRDHAYLADFGLTQALGEPGLTRTGQFVGTLDYIAPEQIHGKPATQRSDVYSFGAVLFECLTGKVPYPRESDAATLFAHVSEPLPRVSELRPGAPAHVDEVLNRAMAKDPETRLPTATAVMDELAAAIGERAARAAAAADRHAARPDRLDRRARARAARRHDRLRHARRRRRRARPSSTARRAPRRSARARRRRRTASRCIIAVDRDRRRARRRRRRRALADAGGQAEARPGGRRPRELRRRGRRRAGSRCHGQGDQAARAVREGHRSADPADGGGGARAALRGHRERQLRRSSRRRPTRPSTAQLLRALGDARDEWYTRWRKAIADNDAGRVRHRVEAAGGHGRDARSTRRSRRSTGAHSERRAHRRPPARPHRRPAAAARPRGRDRARRHRRRVRRRRRRPARPQRHDQARRGARAHRRDAARRPAAARTRACATATRSRCEPAADAPTGPPAPRNDPHVASTSSSSAAPRPGRMVSLAARRLRDRPRRELRRHGRGPVDVAPAPAGEDRRRAA